MTTPDRTATPSLGAASRGRGSAGPAVTTPISRLLNLIGIVVVGYSFVSSPASSDDARDRAAWVLVLTVLALACWLTSVVLPAAAPAPVTASLYAVMIVAGALVTPVTNGLLVVPVAIGVVRLFGVLGWALWWAALGATVALGLVAVGALLSPVAALALLSMEAGVLLAAVVGLSRRQFRVAEQQERALLEERVSIREQRARAEVLVQRQAVARDIHDLLAHSLGGLVIQLDAVEALLEAGRTADATTRVRDARALAAAGLDDARRAVDALRDGAAMSGKDVARSLDDLVSAHRALGGAVDYRVVGTPTPLGPEAAAALVRALQEALTNARRHARDAPVEVAVDWTEGVHLMVTNEVFASDATRGGGHGLTGMAERFAAVDGASVTTGERNGTFVVDARLPARAAEESGTTP